jgi:hypothetical protein
MKEEFLHYLWKYRLYDPERLVSPSGNKITVLRPGEYNRDSGPDFFNARITHDGTVWAGNIEIHTKASHFDTHGHQNDPAFDNVILHVVGENDRKVFNSRGEELLTVELFYDPALFERYLDLVQNPKAIACQDELGGADSFLVRHWLTSLVVERLAEKASAVSSVYAETGNDWEETFYRMLARYFGFRVNSEPFGLLASALPFRVIRKHADNLFQVEALLFGTAGMLEEGLFRDALNDEYYRDLTREYKVLSAKYSLKPVHGWLWKFSRLRPVNFPTVRISQLAAMLMVTGGLFSRVLEATDISHLTGLFEVSASPYWEDHFVFGKKSRKIGKRAGMQAALILVLNAVLPVIFAYGRAKGLDSYCERVLSFLDELPPEENVIIDEWREAGIDAGSALSSQALLQLRNQYCRKRRCLECRIGSSLVSRGITLKPHDELMLEPHGPGDKYFLNSVRDEPVN